jgi:hypothetical protein
MNRKMRRAQDRKKFRLLKGGKPPEAPDAHPDDTPAVRFGKSLRTLCLLTQDLSPMEMVKVLMQFTAAMALPLGADPAAFGAAAQHTMQEEMDEPVG